MMKALVRVGGLTFLLWIVAALPLSAPAQQGRLGEELSDPTLMMLRELQEWENEHGGTDCTGECASGACCTGRML
jgi:hypothetical protein